MMYQLWPSRQTHRHAAGESVASRNAAAAVAGVKPCSHVRHDNDNSSYLLRGLSACTLYDNALTCKSQETGDKFVNRRALLSYSRIMRLVLSYLWIELYVCSLQPAVCASLHHCRDSTVGWLIPAIYPSEHISPTTTFWCHLLVLQLTQTARRRFVGPTDRHDMPLCSVCWPLIDFPCSWYMSCY